jgi:hypothetical protein
VNLDHQLRLLASSSRSNAINLPLSSTSKRTAEILPAKGDINIDAIYIFYQRIHALPQKDGSWCPLPFVAIAHHFFCERLPISMLSFISSRNESCSGLNPIAVPHQLYLLGQTRLPMLQAPVNDLFHRRSTC